MTGETIPMAIFECSTCGMQATVVLNEVATLAWLDHMETHALKDNYRCWTWAVLPLDLSV